MSNILRLCLVSSRGGHLYQLYQLKKWWRKYERFWITDKGSDVSSLLKNERKYYGYFPESRNILNAIKNFRLGIAIFRHEKPNLVVSCGAGIAPPILFAAKLFGAQVVFIDSISFVRYPSLSAKIVSIFADKTLVQHKHMTKKLYKAKYWGNIL